MASAKTDTGIPDMIAVGQSLPSVELTEMTADGPVTFDIAERVAGKTVVLFAVPGAFTPTCHAAHLPGFVVEADNIKAKGVDEIICVSVNDVFVMDAWGKTQNADEIVMAADGSADFARAVGLELDLMARGLGVRSKRYAMVLKSGVVAYLGVEEGTEITGSGAAAVLSAL